MGRTRVAVLGTARLELRDGTSVPLRGTSALVAGFLAVHASAGGTVPRDRVAFSLWPDRPEPKARRALNDAVYRLRQLTAPSAGRGAAADDAVLDTTGDELALGTAVDTDVGQFERLAASGDPADWRAALDLYEGPLLADVDAAWADEARRALAFEHVRLLAAAWDERRHAGDLAAALDIARRWVAAEPFDDAAERAMLRSLARAGALDEALRHFAEFESRLAGELGVEPDDSTVALVEQLRSEADFERRRDVVEHHRARFVGRREERGRLVTLAGRCVDGRGGLAVVIGEPGIGKTRLLDELTAAASWRGATVSRVTVHENDRLSPDGAVVAALREAVPPLRREMLADLLHPVWLHQLDALLDGHDRGDTVPAELVPTVRQTLVALAGIAPQVWLLDDLHWSGDDVWRALDALRPDLEHHRVLVVVSTRRRELLERSTPWELVGEWDVEGVPILHLGPLSDAAIAELVDDVARAADRQPEPAEIVAASGGNPLVAVALCSLPGAGGREDAPSSVVDVVLRQLATVDAAVVDALEAAAVLGDGFEYGLWRAVVDDVDLPVHAATAERSGFLVADDRGYRFANSAMRTVIGERMEPGRARALHARALRELEARAPEHGVALLAHAEAAGLAPEISRFALEVGTKALGASRFELAAQHFRRSLDSHDDPPRRRTALFGLVQALSVLADRDAEKEAIDRLIAASRELDGPQRAGVRRLLARWQNATGRFAEAIETVHGATALLDSVAAARHHPSQSVLRASLALDEAAALRALGRMDEAAAAAERALHGYGLAGDEYGEATATDLLGGIAWARAEFDAAAARHADAAARFADLGAPSARARALNNLGSAEWGRGAYLAADRVHEEALALSRALGDRQSEGDNLDNLGGVAFMLGDHDTAAERYRAALAIRRATADPWGVSISLSNLGDVYRALGDAERALSHYGESIEENARAGVVRNEATTLQGLALTLVDAGRAAEALPILEDVAGRHAELGDHANRQETLVGLVKARLALGDDAGAAAVVAELLERQRPEDRPDLRQIVHLAAAEVATRVGDRGEAADHLAVAATAMRESLHALDPVDRERAVASMPHHRDTVAALAAASEQIVAHLTPCDAARGTVLASAELIPVVWTIRAPGDAGLRTAEGRRAVLLRLLAEADDQGATATDDDLAAALGVSRRTVLRDMAAIRTTAGAAVPATRGRRRAT